MVNETGRGSAWLESWIEMMLEKTSNAIFLVYLLVAAWKDYRTREIEGWIFMVAGLGGLIVCSIKCLAGHRTWLEIVLSCSVGVGLLALGRLSNGGIGEGDGWFFVVSGLYLSGLENMGLFLSGLCVCFLWSLPLAVKAILENGKGRKRELPFLPFLLPAGVWFAVS